MTDTVLKIENLGKSYLIGHNLEGRENYFTLRDSVVRNIKNLTRKTRDMFSGQAIVQGDEIEEFWALNGINFEIKRGERVGILGRNGAGKSTLLKILSRITEPTVGRVTVNGHISSLLEVGTGFHPELTGRENIYLNGAILGMSRKQIQQKFDEIVDFAEVENFLDTPVKRYSSGMYVRLAFAVSAHLEPDILVVDEVLAVGDSEFQKKCIGKMEDVSRNGRTILFVSHSMAALESLTQKSLLLDHGNLVMEGSTSDCIRHYLSSAMDVGKSKVLNYMDMSIEVVSTDKFGQPQTTFQTGADISLRIACLAKNKINGIDFQIAIFMTNGLRLLTLSGRFQTEERFSLQGDSVVIADWIKPCLSPGVYDLTLSIYRDNVYQKHWDNIIRINIIESDYFRTGKFPDSGCGPILQHCNWSKIDL